MAEKYLGETIKKLGFGLMRLPEKDGKIDIDHVKKMVDAFMENGFTYFDTAYVYHGGLSEGIAKTAVVDRYPRESFQLATKLPLFDMKSADEMESAFNTSLERSGVDYFDFYLLHCIDKGNGKKADEFGAWDFIKRIKAEGKAKHIGFSFHESAAYLDELLSAHPETEFVQLQINYLDWEDERVQSRKCYEVAMKHNVPVIIMEPVKGGALVANPELTKLFATETPGFSNAAMAIRYAASLDNVITVLSGMSNIDQINDNVSYMREFKKLSDAEYKTVLKATEILNSIEKIPCTKCKYCVDGCPQKINIPEVFAAFNNWNVYKTPKVYHAEYERAVKDGGKASDCIECGQCEGHCPQRISIIEELKRVASEME